jgi:hypothetical protein
MISENNILGDNSSQKNQLNHCNFLQEIYFWTVQYKYPEYMVCWLLKMLSDSNFKESLAEAIISHYKCAVQLMETTTSDLDKLCSKIAKINCQFLSHEELATHMVMKFDFIKIIILNLRKEMTKILIRSTLHGKIILC